MTSAKWIGRMWAVVFVFLPLVAVAGEVALPKTGQTTCYDASGNVTGQDGDVQAGVEWPEPRFTDNSNGTVTDNLTGLIWLKNANCFGTKAWANAVSDCNTLADGSCGLADGSVAGDWRLPNIVELESLVNAQIANPSTWLNTQGFTNVQSSNYWSSSTYANGTYNAWYVYMYYGSVHYNSKSFSSYVCPVRGGQ